MQPLHGPIGPEPRWLSLDVPLLACCIDEAHGLPLHQCALRQDNPTHHGPVRARLPRCVEHTQRHAHQLRSVGRPFGQSPSDELHRLPAIRLAFGDDLGRIPLPRREALQVGAVVLERAFLPEDLVPRPALAPLNPASDGPASEPGQPNRGWVGDEWGPDLGGLQVTHHAFLRQDLRGAGEEDDLLDAIRSVRPPGSELDPLPSLELDRVLQVDQFRPVVAAIEDADTAALAVDIERVLLDPGFIAGEDARPIRPLGRLRSNDRRVSGPPGRPFSVLIVDHPEALELALAHRRPYIRLVGADPLQ